MNSSKEFNSYSEYDSPEVIHVNKHVTLAVYVPTRTPTNKELMVEIHNSKTDSSIMLFYNTLIHITDSMYKIHITRNKEYIDSLIKSNKKKIKNKRKKKKV